MSVNAMPDHSCNYVVINNRSWMENSSDVGLMRRGDGDNGIARSVASHGGHRLPTVCEDEKEENEECVEEEEEEEDGDDSEIVVAPLLMKSTSLCNYTSSACKDAKRKHLKQNQKQKMKRSASGGSIIVTKLKRACRHLASVTHNTTSHVLHLLLCNHHHHHQRILLTTTRPSRPTPTPPSSLPCVSNNHVM